MWLQPWFFSIGRRHLGQCLVWVSTQLAVSESETFLSRHARTVPHDSGRCASSPQLQQKPCAHSQKTSAPSPTNSRARVHPAAGHHLTPLPLYSTYDRSANRAYKEGEARVRLH